MLESMAMEDSAAPQMATAKDATASVGGAKEIDFSTTNIQVAGVDEPDIFKNNGTTLYYINNEDNTIEIVQSPLKSDTTSIDLTQTKQLAQIRLPKTLNGDRKSVV